MYSYQKQGSAKFVSGISNFQKYYDFFIMSPSKSPKNGRNGSHGLNSRNIFDS